MGRYAGLRESGGVWRSGRKAAAGLGAVVLRSLTGRGGEVVLVAVNAA
jgi:hypothetical protein